MSENVSSKKLLDGVKGYISQFSKEELIKKLERRKQQIEARKITNFDWLVSPPCVYEKTTMLQNQFTVKRDRRSFGRSLGQGWENSSTSYSGQDIAILTCKNIPFPEAA